MKLKIIFFIVLIIFITILCACTNMKTENDTLKIAEKYNKAISGDQYDYQKDLFDWLTPEVKYYYAADGDRVDNIIRIEDNYIVRGDRLYFKITRDHNSDIWAYVGLRTGEKLCLCPDPLCPHTKDSECKYLNIKDLVFTSGSDNKFYAIKTVVSDNGTYDAIFFIDTENDIISELYNPAFKSSDIADIFNIDLYFFNGSKIYFLITKTYKEKNDGRELVRKSESKTMTLDIDTKTVEEYTNKYSSGQYGDFLLSNDKYLFFMIFITADFMQPI